jgi:hypothetical protein
MTAPVVPRGTSTYHRVRAWWSDAGALETAILTAVLVFVVAGGVLLVVLTIRGLGTVPEPKEDTTHGKILVAVSAAAFLLGRFVQRVRHRAVRKPARPPRTGSAAVTHLGLLLFFAAGTCALGYEAIGLWTPPGGNNGASPWGIHPITHYIRYAKEVAAPATGIVAVVLSFLIGHWLWPPREPAATAGGGT